MKLSKHIQTFAYAAVALTAASMTGGAFAQEATPIEVTDITPVFNLTSLITAVAVLAGGAFVAALTTGAGFRIGKKAYSWVMSKI